MATILTQIYPLLSTPFSSPMDFTVLAEHCEQFAETLLERGAGAAPGTLYTAYRMPCPLAAHAERSYPTTLD